MRDPYVFEDSDGAVYLIYAGNGEDALGIAALSSPQQTINVLEPREDAYVRDGAYANNNFGNDETLDIKFGGNEDFFRRTYLNFDLDDIDDIDSAVLRLYATQSNSSVTITLSATSNTWDEDTVTWNTAPARGTTIARVAMGPEDQWYEWDVSSY